MLLTLSAPCHPAVVDLFEGWESAGHFALGFGAGMLLRSTDPAWGLAVLSGFVGYQVSQAAPSAACGPGESWTRTGGEFIEFGLGALAAALFKKAIDL